MYNKLKNLIPHKIKIDNFTTKLLEKDDAELLKNFFENNKDFFIVSASPEPTLDEIKNKLNLTENNFNIGIFENSNLLSFVELLKISNIDNSWTIKIFIVDKNQQGKGLASKILSSLEELFLSIKSDVLQADINKNNTCLVKFFKHANFIENQNDKNILFIKKLEKKENNFLNKCFKNGKLIFISSKLEEKKEIYKVMQAWFEKEKKYTELEVNSILKKNIEISDFATLRRDMVDSNFMHRRDNGKEYWI